MPTVKVSIDCKDIRRTLESAPLGQFVANRAREYMEPYVPYRSGDLSKSAVAEPFKVSYLKEYAHRVWEGTGMKIHSGDKAHHPLATSHWDKAMEAMRGGELAQDISDYLARG